MLWGLKLVLFCFNSLPTFLRIKLDCPHSLRCCQARDAMPSSFDIEVGIKMESWNCCKAVMLRSAFPTMRTPLRLGKLRRAMSTSVDTGRAGAIGGATAAKPWLAGQRRSIVGGANAATFSFISTTIKRPLRPRMRNVFSGS